MTSALDVAVHTLEARGEMTTWKLQKLVYYCQAWSLVWDEEPLFEEPIEAWANGPVVRALYDAHRGQFRVGPTQILGDPSKLSEYQRETIDAVLDEYGDKDGHWLRQLTHDEPPWRDARQAAGLASGERGSPVITHGAMADYYGSL
jgi:uncharacterized phage-associated protein